MSGHVGYTIIGKDACSREWELMMDVEAWVAEAWS